MTKMPQCLDATPFTASIGHAATPFMHKMPLIFTAHLSLGHAAAPFMHKNASLFTMHTKSPLDHAATPFMHKNASFSRRIVRY
jgi:hypothetical protein